MAGVLAAVLLIVLVGLILTSFLPPRAHVLTVGDREFNARAIADRAHYLVTSGNGNAQRDPAEEAVTSLVSQQILLQVGAGLVDEVTDQDVRVVIAQRLNLAEEFTDQEYADALTSFLRVAPIARTDLEEIVRAGIIEDRLEERFRAELPEAGDQMDLRAVATNDRAAAQALVDAVRGGQAFADAAVEVGVIDSAEEVQELGWFAPTSLNDRVAPSVQELQTGEVSEPLDDANRIGFEVFYVDYRSVDEPYQDEVRDQLARRAYNEWLDEQELTIGVEIDLADSEDDWIRRQVQEALSG